jgi:uncharacterized membrane protein (UPF0127 family)
MVTGLIILIIIFAFVSLCQVVRLYIYPSNGVLVLAVAVMLNFLELPLDVKLAHGFQAPAVEPSKHEMIVLDMLSNTSNERRIFHVVLVCDTPEARATGLQGFRRLKKDEAALFVFDKIEVVTFWMGNVTYTIDIIFVGSDQKVIRVFRNCKPGSRDLYSSGDPVQWVLETAAGSGIKTGDRLMINSVQKP